MADNDRINALDELRATIVRNKTHHHAEMCRASPDTATVRVGIHHMIAIDGSEVKFGAVGAAYMVPLRTANRIAAFIGADAEVVDAATWHMQRRDQCQEVINELCVKIEALRNQSTFTVNV